MNLHCWMFRVVPFFLKAEILEYWSIVVLVFGNTGYWNTPNCGTAILGSINSIHIKTVYTIHWVYILCTFFHIHIHYFTHILYMYLLILYMHTFTHVCTNIFFYFYMYIYTCTFTHTIYIMQIACLLVHWIHAITVHTFYNVYAALLLYSFVYFINITSFNVCKQYFKFKTTVWNNISTKHKKELGCHLQL